MLQERRAAAAPFAMEGSSLFVWSEDRYRMDSVAAGVVAPSFTSREVRRRRDIDGDRMSSASA